jgi:hypothetical protein
MSKCDNKECDNDAMFTMWNTQLQFGVNVCYNHYKAIEMKEPGKFELRKLETHD